MIAIEIKQNDMDGKFVTMLENQHVHTQVLIDNKSMFSEFIRGQKHTTKIVEMEPIVDFE
jgi:hypothetical protein